MSDDQDDSQKTEEPTQKRLDDSLKKGQVPFSKEVTTFMMLFAFAIIIWAYSPTMFQSTATRMHDFIANPHDIRIDSHSIIDIAQKVIIDLLWILLIPISILFVIALSSRYIQYSPVFSITPIIPKLERISVLKGLKRLFSMRTVIEFGKGLFKICAVIIAGVIAIYPELDTITQGITRTPEAEVAFLADLAFRLVFAACIVIGVIAFFDFLYQRFEYVKNLRMSKQDIKDEYKQTEGNPEVKAKLRQLRQERANNRMMAEVPNADVVVTNPTHYSVALRYNMENDNAPVVVAKGQDFIALKIREIAKENDIPIIENPPLARALHASVEVDQEIPVDHYQAVAEIIKYVYKLKGKKPHKTSM